MVLLLVVGCTDRPTVATGSQPGTPPLEPQAVPAPAAESEHFAEPQGGGQVDAPALTDGPGAALVPAPPIPLVDVFGSDRDAVAVGRVEVNQLGRWVHYESGLRVMFRDGLPNVLRVPCDLSGGDLSELADLGLPVSGDERVENARSARVVNLRGYHVETRNRVCEIRRTPCSD